MHRAGEAITVVTAYDYTSARIAAACGIDAVLVGDSLGNVILGHDSTVPVTMDDMVSHTAAVTRTLAGRGPWVFADLPFGSYTTVDTAVANAVRLIKEGGAAAVKMEGGATQPRVLEQTAAIVAAGIPVVGHLGFTPQTAAALGGYTVQGRTAAGAIRLVEEAQALQAAGCVALVLEMVPTRIAAEVTRMLDIPTIGIGAGPDTSGQVLVFHDLVGLFDKFAPKFAPRFSEAGAAMAQGVTAYREQVKNRSFPDPVKHGYAMPEADYDEFLAVTGKLSKLNNAADSKAPTVSGSIGTGSETRTRTANNLAPKGTRRSASMQHTPVATRRRVSTTAALLAPDVDGGVNGRIGRDGEDGDVLLPRRVAVLGGGALGSFMASQLIKVPDTKVSGVATDEQ